MNKSKYSAPFFLLGLALFSIAACRSAGPTPVSSKPQDCIRRVIALDDSLGAVRNHACETISLAETIRNYADGMSRANFRHCPAEFATAFEKHRQAWLNLIPLVEKYPELRGEMHALFNQLEKGDDAETFKPLLKAIWDTWGEVEAAMK